MKILGAFFSICTGFGCLVQAAEVSSSLPALSSNSSENRSAASAFVSIEEILADLRMNGNVYGGFVSVDLMTTVAHLADGGVCQSFDQSGTLEETFKLSYSKADDSVSVVGPSGRAESCGLMEGGAILMCGDHPESMLLAVDIQGNAGLGKTKEIEAGKSSLYAVAAEGMVASLSDPRGPSFVKRQIVCVGMVKPVLR